MAVGYNNGTYVPAHLRAAVEAPGFEEAARALRWDAPQAAVRPQPDERSTREREERAQAQKTIENGLSSIRMALANPNLSDAQRAELSQQQSQLEGLQTQLTTGARSVDVAHVSAVAAQVSSSVSATVASVGMGSGGSAQMAQIAAQAGVSVEYARSLGGHVITNNMNVGQARETFARAVEHVQHTHNRNNDRLRSIGAPLAGTEEERARWEKDIRDGTRPDSTPEQKAAADQALRERIEASRKAAEEAQSEEARRIHQNNLQGDQRLREQQGRLRQIERQHADPSLTPEQRAQAEREHGERHQAQLRDVRNAGSATVTHNAANLQHVIASSIQGARDVQRGTVAGTSAHDVQRGPLGGTGAVRDVATSVTLRVENDGKAEEQFSGVFSSATSQSLTPTVSPQQQAVAAATPVAAKVTNPTDASAKDTADAPQAPKVSENQTPTSGRSGRA